MERLLLACYIRGLRFLASRLAWRTWGLMLMCHHPRWRYSRLESICIYIAFNYLFNPIGLEISASSSVQFLAHWLLYSTPRQILQRPHLKFIHRFTPHILYKYIMCEFEEYLFSCGHSTVRLKNHCHIARNSTGHKCRGVKVLRSSWYQGVPCESCGTPVKLDCPAVPIRNS